MVRKKIEHNESINYIEDVLENWEKWQTHHKGLTEALKGVLSYIDSQDRKIEALAENRKCLALLIDEVEKEKKELFDENKRLTEKQEKLMQEMDDLSREYALYKRFHYEHIHSDVGETSSIDTQTLAEKLEFISDTLRSDYCKKVLKDSAKRLIDLEKIANGYQKQVNELFRKRGVLGWLKRK